MTNDVGSTARKSKLVLSVTYTSTHGTRPCISVEIRYNTWNDRARALGMRIGLPTQQAWLCNGEHSKSLKPCYHSFGRPAFGRAQSATAWWAILIPPQTPLWLPLEVRCGAAEAAPAFYSSTTSHREQAHVPHAQYDYHNAFLSNKSRARNSSNLQ